MAWRRSAVETASSPNIDAAELPRDPGVERIEGNRQGGARQQHRDEPEHCGHRSHPALLSTRRADRSYNTGYYTAFRAVFQRRTIPPGERRRTPGARSSTRPSICSRPSARAALSIREVCARAGVTAPTIYHHFGDKAALVDARRRRLLRRFRPRVRPPRGAPRSGRGAALGLRSLRRVRLRHPIHYRLMFARAPSRPSAPGLASYDGLRRRVMAIADAGRLARAGRGGDGRVLGLRARRAPRC